jgi:16S rRNA (cytidine1402-2'-O)-methyltransferase
MGVLYVVATPIGNLEDVTLRALRLLREVPLIVAEDTRTIRKLLTHHGIPTPRLLSYTEQSRAARTPAILAALREGDAALVSEAGMPAISDPGVHLVEAAVAAGFRVVPVPGASALTTALAASALPARRVRYLGFLPRAAGERRRLLVEVAGAPETLVAFEAPHRVRQTLRDAYDALGDRRIAVCREMTKLHEEIFRGTLSEAVEHFAAPRGEFTLVIEGASDAEAAPVPAAEIDAALRRLKRRGALAREAVREVTAQTGAPRRQVYQRWLALRDE